MLAADQIRTNPVYNDNVGFFRVRVFHIKLK